MLINAKTKPNTTRSQHSTCNHPTSSDLEVGWDHFGCIRDCRRDM
jgi:hypothetical protein